jgi:hypothetical protein
MPSASWLGEVARTNGGKIVPRSALTAI